jgi:hypothetical protein
MKKRRWQFAAVALILMTQAAFSQNVKIGNVALGMNEVEIKAALASAAPHYLNQTSEYTGLYYLVAETDAESFAFTLMDGRVAAFSLVHILPSGQQPFLPVGQEPTVAVLRNLVEKHTWVPTTIKNGDTFWLSDAAGVPLTDVSLCHPKSGEAWLLFAPMRQAIPRDSPAQSMIGLMKPALVPYSATCGVSIHLNETPAKSENDRVTSVRIQVLDIITMNRFVATHQLH